jgi:hypothetical protein
VVELRAAGRGWRQIASAACFSSGLYNVGSHMSRVPEREHSPIVVMAGLAAAAALCLWGTFETYAFETAYQQQNRDPYMIGAQFDRLAPVAAVVPQNAILGYLTDVPQGSLTESAMLIGAQYVLAPRLVVRGAGQEWVLGNFTRPADFGAFGRSRGLELLFRGEPKR